MTLHSSTPNQSQRVPLCPICNMPVLLETAKTDEHGRAIHEECYLLAMKLTLESGFEIL